MLGGREVVSRNVPPLVPPPRKKWLNIVFNLNGVLCQSAMKLYADKFRPYRVKEKVLCHRNPTIIGPKAVFARQNLGEFLRQVSAITSRVQVWTTMFKRNAEPIARHLFNGCGEPFDILGQEQCKKIELSPEKFFDCGLKMCCLKVLSKTLFVENELETSSLNANNTILIDDSPEKSVCNENGNAIFLETWSHERRRDNVLMGELLLWLCRLESNCEQGQLRQYVEENRIGMNPLSAGQYPLEDIISGMRESSRVMGSRFKLPRIGVVVEKGRRRK